MRAVLCVVVLAAAACARTGDGVAARVNGEPVLRSAVEARAAATLTRLRLEEGDALRASLDALVEERLLDQEAARRGLSRGDLVRADEEQKGALREALRQSGRVEILLERPQVRLDTLPDDRSLGPPEAPVTIVEYMDYQCGYCRRAQPVVDEILKRHAGSVRFVVRDYLIAPQHLGTARAGRCALEQGRFWEMHQSLFAPPGDFSKDALAARAGALGLDASAFAACIESDRNDKAIATSHESGAALGLLGTPTFFVNGARFTGVLGSEAFERLVRDELSRSGS